jgi:hypothetical protein
MAVLDVEAAYKLLPVHPADWPKLLMRWEGNYWVATRLPFGVASGPAIYNRFGAAVQRILEASGVGSME